MKTTNENDKKNLTPVVAFPEQSHASDQEWNQHMDLELDQHDPEAVLENKTESPPGNPSKKRQTRKQATKPEKAQTKQTKQSGKKNTTSAESSSQELVLFGNLFKERRKKWKLSQKELADMLHVTRNTIMNWESDRSKPDYNLIPEICAILGIQAHELFHMQPENGLSEQENRIVNNLRKLTKVNRRLADRMVTHMVSEQYMEQDRTFRRTFDLFLVRPGSVAAGVGDYVPWEPPTYTFLRKNNINEKADGIVKVRGYSMEPVYHNGDYVYYQKAISAFPGEDVIVDTDEGAVIKRMGDDCTLYSVNANYPYPDKNEQNHLVIRGVVLGTVSSSDRASEEECSILEEVFIDEIRDFKETYALEE